MASGRVRASALSALSLGMLAGPALAATLDPLFGNGFETGLVAFGPALSSVPLGVSNTASAAVALSVTLDQPAAGATFVAVVSGDPVRLSVSGGGATVATGQTSATVLLNGLVAGSAPVALWANYGNTLGASVRVEQSLNETNVGDEADLCYLQSPASFLVLATTATPPLYGRLFEAGTTESAGPPANWQAEAGYGPSGSDPRLLTGWHFTSAPYDSQQATEDQYQVAITAAADPGTYSTVYRFSHDDGGSWTYCDKDGAGSSGGATFDTAQLGSMTVLPKYSGLMINELDYDNVGSADNQEFVEIYNGGVLPIDLSDVALAFINGNDNAEYHRYSLAAMGTIQPGQYGVVGPTSVVASLPLSVLRVDLGAVSTVIQNGAPDGVALIDTADLTLIDALSYEGSVTAAVIGGFANPVSLVEGTALSASIADSTTLQGDLQRLPNGTDGNNAATDWNFTTTITPGSANLP